MADFSTSVSDKGDVSIIYLEGFLDAHTTPVLENAFTSVLDRNRFKIIVDFEKLTYISSAGLGVFMAFIEKARENEGDIKLTTMNSKVYNIFDLLGFPLLYEIFDSETEAINKFNENKIENGKK